MFRQKELIYEFCPFWTEYDCEDGSSGKNSFRKQDTAWAFTAEVKHVVHLRRILRCDTSLKREPFLLLKQQSEDFTKGTGCE